MADAMVVNVPPYEGEYEFDLTTQPLSTVEWRWVKQISGYLPLTLAEGWKGGDPDVFLCFAVIAMRRAGKIEKTDVLEVAAELEEAVVDGTAITFKGEAAEEELDPTPAPEPEDSKPDSGESSEPPTEASPESETPKASGIQDWATGADSDRLTLAK